VSRTNILYLVVGAFIVVIAVMSFQIYQEHQKPDLNIQIGPNGISVDKK
jgi:predicted negative regulator of RcsB-dependent stress response